MVEPAVAAHASTPPPQAPASGVHQCLITVHRRVSTADYAMKLTRPAIIDVRTAGVSAASPSRGQAVSEREKIG